MKYSSLAVLTAFAVVAAGSVAGCTDQQPTGSASGPSAPGQPPEARGCPVTVPHPVQDQTVGDFYGSDSSVGNGLLWVGGLGPNGVIRVDPGRVGADGSVLIKLGWWRGVPGELLISGRRVDGSAPPLRADVPSGYGDRGFQSTGLNVPTAGCWEVTGKVGGATLTFHTVLVTAPTSAAPT